MPTSRINRRFGTAFRIAVAIAFLLPALTIGVGLLRGGPWNGIWLTAGPPIRGVWTPAWVWVVPLLVQLLLLVVVVALGYLVVRSMTDPG